MSASPTPTTDPCQEPGCDEDGWPCFLPDGRFEPDGTYCGTHAVKYGFCRWCRNFYGGIESFDFGPHAGICDDCASDEDAELEDILGEPEYGPDW